MTIVLVLRIAFSLLLFMVVVSALVHIVSGLSFLSRMSVTNRWLAAWEGTKRLRASTSMGELIDIAHRACEAAREKGLILPNGHSRSWFEKRQLRLVRSLLQAKGNELFAVRYDEKRLVAGEGSYTWILTEDEVSLGGGILSSDWMRRVSIRDGWNLTKSSNLCLRDIGYAVLRAAEFGTTKIQGAEVWA